MESDSNEQTMRTLVLKRGQLKAQITRFQTFLDNFKCENREKSEIETRLTRIDGILDLFETTQNQIELLSNFEIQETERNSFEESYYAVIAKAQKLLNQFKSHSEGDLVCSTPSADQSSNTVDKNTPCGEINDPFNITSNIKLPDINLPDFHGLYNNWMTFYDTFNTLIHENQQLSNIQKFYYLKSCLKGEAAQLIQSIEISNVNYDIAWSMLKERYENKKLIINTHMKAIYDLTAVKFESPIQLRKLLDNFNKNFRALTALGQPTIHWDTPMMYTLASKLDPATKRAWEQHITNWEIDNITIKKLTEFLSQRCQLLESIETKTKTVDFKNVTSNKTSAHLTTSKITCSFCKKNHANQHCDYFQKLTVTNRLNETKKYKLCLNCLRPGHFVQDCKSGNCRTCERKHNTLLHLTHSRENIQVESKNDDRGEENPVSSVSHTHTTTMTINSVRKQANISQVLLATAMVHVLDLHGNKIACRALLDSGSQSNFVTSSLIEKLKLRVTPTQIPVAGINCSLSSISQKTEMMLCATNSKYKTKGTFLILERITENLPYVSFDSSMVNLPANIEFADPNFNESKPIDLLLGASIFYDILCVGQIKYTKTSPIMQKTRLGWIISGPLNLPHQNVNCNLAISNVDLHNQVKAFWELEEMPNHKHYTTEETECEQHFMHTFKRDDSGRFELQLPLKCNASLLGHSEETALKRFLGLEKRLQRDQTLKSLYVNFMEEYKSLGHMTEIPNDSLETDNLKYYLPHHGILKDSTTTKLRVVFDASCQTSSGLSLNDVLKVGPTIQRDLVSIILKFRKHNVVCIADVEKMYRQCNIASEHRDLQRILWRAEPTETVKHFRLNTITYGTASAPFLACRALHQLAIEHEDLYPIASNVIKNDFYMDDLITGAKDLHEALQLKREISDILQSGGFHLRKWCSNCPELLTNQDSKTLSEYHISNNENIKALGLVWNPKGDNLTYSVNIPECKSVTKRSILSTVSKIFDPLGLISPTIVQAKLILQRLWETQVTWDESIPLELHTLWQQFFESLPNLNNVQIPRQVTISDFIDIQLHGFSDASELAFGACLYIRVTCPNGKHYSKLLCAKSKVAPMKRITLPRLELNAALLLARLVSKIETSLDMKIARKILWCDSTIVLNWLAAEPSNWHTYVANRVAEIHELCKHLVWRHIPSDMNPADIISRGCSPMNLLKNDLWWFGPNFLQNNETLWPETEYQYEEAPEKRKLIPISLVTSNVDFIFNRYSSLTQLHRVFTYVCRFLYNIKPSNTVKLRGELTPNELNQALTLLLKLTQNQAFSEDLKLLRANKTLSNSSKLLSLNVFLDEQGLLRVGGRIRHSIQTFDKKHPILLPSNHPLTKLIIDYEHKRNLHAGQQFVLAAVRQKYWPLNGKSVVRSVLRKCIICFKAKPSNSNPQMGDLPRARLQEARPFSSVGVDFAGPLMIKDGVLRTRKLVKCYICVFVCFITKAVHLELVGELSTHAFLNCLKRFISRRGFCRNIYSDNGTNFVGANNELKSVLIALQKNPELREFFLNSSITWHFNPPYSPHQGGLWEAAVKSAKYHLVRIVGNAHLTFEALYTVLCQIEAILNSRPLLSLSDDPNDLSALTPAHFLVGDSLIAIPEHDITNITTNRLKLYQHLQQMVQHFWQRWSTEYLSSLQQRSRWKKKTASVAVGDLVILKDSTPPMLWKLGRIAELHPGKDNITRVVSVIVNGNLVKRNVAYICKLPLDDF